MPLVHYFPAETLGQVLNAIIERVVGVRKTTQSSTFNSEIQGAPYNIIGPQSAQTQFTTSVKARGESQYNADQHAVLAVNLTYCPSLPAM